MRDKPYMVINVITDETIGWYKSEFDARVENRGKPIAVIYRPGRKAKVKRNA